MKNSNNKILIIILAILILLGVFGVILINNSSSSNPNTEEKNDQNLDNELPNDDVIPDDSEEDEDNEDIVVEDEEEIEAECNDVTMPSIITSNSIEEFDFKFLQIENQKSNKIYSPISIKYALKMMEEASNGETKTQISNLMGNYTVNKYTNSSNMAFANGMFINNLYKNSINSSYINTLSSKYNADIVYDSFVTPVNLNNWVSNKTLNLINNIVDDISMEKFVLVNALGIDMEWKNKIRDTYEDYYVSYAHRNFYKYIPAFEGNGYDKLDFGNEKLGVNALEIGAVINRYDIIEELGEDNIRTTVTNDYENWLSTGASSSCVGVENELDSKTYVDNYIKEISLGYNDISSSTDFKFYVDNDVKVFSKDLKEYNGKTLQYVGIMPNNVELKEYINNIKVSDITSYVNNLKSIEVNNFKDGVVTEIKGYIPMFKFEYELQLKDDLGKLGVVDIFDLQKADLSNLINEQTNIGSVKHKSKIEFSNEGIKAAASTIVMGSGAGDCGYDYIFEVPVETIDLTFDKPYLFMIIDKDTKEVWFTGTVYEPLEFDFNQGGR